MRGSLTKRTISMLILLQLTRVKNTKPVHKGHDWLPLSSKSHIPSKALFVIHHTLKKLKNIKTQSID
ncbi:hypothetical protein GLYMA_14G071800v4 [Glycine max]|uniref:Uncharacterized protein n=1 Tax=Glycine max TaxID=3847 RepID=K7M5E1_SOYBN|nr:hypothetical protein GYH30_039276 [Glycine max]KRH15158.1 hypothetical protein GLYMA_14G071800v4 [Glycine max]